MGLFFIMCKHIILLSFLVYLGSSLIAQDKPVISTDRPSQAPLLATVRTRAEHSLNREYCIRHCRMHNPFPLTACGA